jgi:hypothetical protein
MTDKEWWLEEGDELEKALQGLHNALTTTTQNYGSVPHHANATDFTQ